MFTVVFMDLTIMNYRWKDVDYLNCMVIMEKQYCIGE